MIQHPWLRIVAARAEPGGYILDVLGTDGGDQAVGEPFALLLRRPETPWIADWTGFVLSRWADGDESVDFHVKNGRRGLIAVLDGGDQRCSLQIDLVAAV